MAMIFSSSALVILYLIKKVSIQNKNVIPNKQTRLIASMIMGSKTIVERSR